MTSTVPTPRGAREDGVGRRRHRRHRGRRGWRRLIRPFGEGLGHGVPSVGVRGRARGAERRRRAVGSAGATARRRAPARARRRAGTDVRAPDSPGPGCRGTGRPGRRAAPAGRRRAATARRDDRGEQRHHRRAHRGGQMRRPRVAHDDDVRPGQHRGQLGQPGAAAEVERARCACRDLRGERALVGTTGDDDGEAVGGDQPGRAPVVFRRPAARGDGGARMQHDVGTALQRGEQVAERRWVPHREAAGIGRRQPVAGRGGDRQRPLGLGEVVGQVVARPVAGPQPHVEQGAGIVDRRAGDPPDAGEPQQQRRGQR